ncbi:iron-sulfur cluster repair di-iron protein [Flavobacterium sp. UBA6031]|uniref:iron-sulfur cluster repair di-iron protein n=1 Tax=Flavobacterium sp. UBA6031 TaxID=1946551 RepID=UPI0025B7B2E5|nr:iron-sulfur cluster repair di-iron protein [Flavobacterium sp. UBA6031]
MKNYKEIKIGEIVTQDFRAAEIFKNAGIDFCCGGNQSLEQACREKKIDSTVLETELAKLEHTTVNALHNFNEWNLDFLCDYIVNTHHKTVMRLLPQLTAYTQKIEQVHGVHHPELKEIAALFSQINEELLQHLKKEEEVLFPAIKEVLKTNSPASKKIIISEITRMKGEHEFAGGAMDKINVLSDNYSVPDDGCNTYRVTYKLLEEFEDDLHIHVHLENNILYPKALSLAILD